MHALMDWGIDIVLWFQQFRPWLDLPFEAFTFMGEEVFFLILLPLVYWCLERSVGARLLVLFILSAHTNALAKVLANQPRPSLYDDRVWAFSDVGGSNGFPSGHTQNTTVLWSYIAAQVRQRWMWILAALLMILVPMSRIYLGVHFPHDLWGGYLLGALLLFTFLTWEPKIEHWLDQASFSSQVGLAAVATLLIILTMPGENGVASGATLLGASAGFACERRWIAFESRGTWQQWGLRLLLGFVVLFGLWGGLRVVFASMGPVLLLRFVRYGLVGLWTGFGAPWAFVRLGLADGKYSLPAQS